MSCKVRGEITVGPLFIREVDLCCKGSSIPGHTHDFDHVTFFMEGTTRVIGYKGDEQVFDREITAPAYFLIEKDIRHELHAVSNGALAWCVFPSDRSTT